MNEVELDQLLETWKAPLPSPALRQAVCTQFPKAKPRRFVWPRRWVIILALAASMLAIGTEASRPNAWSRKVTGFFHNLYKDLNLAFSAWPTDELLNRIRESDPKTYVDGELADPPTYAQLASWRIYMKMDVNIPGEGAYSVALYQPPGPGWVQAGRIHENVIEFQAGSKSVRVVCNKPIVSVDLPVFVSQRRPPKQPGRPFRVSP